MNIKATLILFLCILFYGCQEKTSISTLPLIPYPNQIELGSDFFKLNSSISIQSTPELQKTAEWLQKVIRDKLNIEVNINQKKKSSGTITLSIEPDTVSNAYTLQINKRNIKISGSDETGVFYAIQTLTQLLPTETTSDAKIPTLTIKDYPRFSWRGMHLDCCRHFFSVKEVKQYIDLLAMYKFNTFHWHLTDDQGWRIEVPGYPLLTQISSQRKETLIGRPWESNKYDGIPYGGYYTTQDMKDIVAYAAERHITVVPEIEMPGHSMAALAAYPNLSCTGKKIDVATTWGVFDDVFCAGNDDVFDLLEDVLTEVMEIFPSEYIHIGGDECPKTHWKKCPKCQKRIKDEKLKNEEELQSYFITRIGKFVNSKGRKIIGWDEILDGGIVPNAAIMSWQGTKGGVKAARSNHFAVMSPTKPCYIDYYQHKPVEEEPLSIGGYNPVDSVYALNPVPEELIPEEAKWIMGAQCNLWTEYIKTYSHVEYMALPRMAAISEVVWTNLENKDFNHFIDRLKIHANVLDKLGINYCRHFLDN